MPVSAAALQEGVTRFRPRARLLQLLGDQLIRSPRLAVFELVKNAYDADATTAHVRITGLDTPQPEISVIDDGEGMTIDVIRNIWFVPGHDHKEKRKQRGELTRLGRLPIGEKGIGRFAAHKLGNKISVVTRSQDHPEVVVELDWEAITVHEYLSDAEAIVRTRVPEVFTGNTTGTKITITELRDRSWTRGELRRLYRALISICSPFAKPGEFTVVFDVPGRNHEFDAIPDANEILGRAPWYYEFEFDGVNFSWHYHFSPPTRLHRRIEPREKNSVATERLLVDYKGDSGKTNKIVADTTILDGIGPVSGQFYAYDRGQDVLGHQSEQQLIKTYLNENGGVRIYRDGIRVYNYGEDDDDWLSLDFRRFLTPALRISRNNILGAISLSLRDSVQLIEKTNREGFVENEAWYRLVALVTGAFNIFETERAIDKEAIRKTARTSTQVEFDKIRHPISEMRRIAKKKKVYEALEPSIDKLERNYDQLRETMLQAGLSGLGLATVFHEIQHGVTSLVKRAKAGASIADIVVHAQDLEQLLSGIAGLLRRSEKRSTSVTELIAKTKQASLIRFRTHRVVLVSPLLEGIQRDFDVAVNSRLIIGALTNLLDNSFYWLRARWPSKPADERDSPRRIYVGRSDDFRQGPALVVADSGPGFQDDPDTLKEPFFTRRPDGMGLGLYYASLVMELSGGDLVFPEKGDVELPVQFDGAIIALVFPSS